jgi:RHS repeat-associated protein
LQSYTGEQNDPTGLEYLRARYYDASTGRFLSQDPVPLLQRYAYANDNPANLVDPSGLSTAKDAQDALVARFEQLMDAERKLQAIARQILADPCWKTHAFCKHVAFVWKKAVDATQRFEDWSEATAKSVSDQMWQGIKTATRPAQYCASSAHLFECYERFEVGSVGVAVTAFGAAIASGGCIVVAPVVGAATAGAGGVVTCGLAIFAGATVIGGGVLIIDGSISP